MYKTSSDSILCSLTFDYMSKITDKPIFLRNRTRVKWKLPHDPCDFIQLFPCCVSSLMIRNYLLVIKECWSSLPYRMTFLPEYSRGQGFLTHVTTGCLKDGDFRKNCQLHEKWGNVSLSSGVDAQLVGCSSGKDPGATVSLSCTRSLGKPRGVSPSVLIHCHVLFSTKKVEFLSSWIWRNKNALLI